MSASTANKPTPKSADRPALAIEELIRWVVRDELPKRRVERLPGPAGIGTASIWRFGVLGVRVDNWSREPGMPAALGDPHPDALRVEAAIKELAQALKAADEGTGPLPFDLSAYRIGEGLGPDCTLARVSARAILDVVPWLLTTAKQGHPPDHGEGVSLRPVMGSRGRVTVWKTFEEVRGEDRDGNPLVVRTDRATEVARGGTYSAGAFCKLAYDRSPTDVAADRASYAAWHAALTWLAERLSGTETVETADGPQEHPILSLWKPRPPSAPMSPWRNPPTPPRVFHVVGAHGEAPMPAEVERESLERPARNPVRHLHPSAWPLAA